MIDTEETFLIDGTGVFEAIHKSFVGVPLLVVDGEDYTFLFGVIRDLLQLRQTIGIDKGLFVVGKEAHSITSNANIEKTVSFLQQFGISVVHDPQASVLDLCVGLASLATCFVTHDRRLLLFASDGRRIILLNDKNEKEVYSSDTVISRLGVTPDLVPQFLALTDGPQPDVVTRREAIAFLKLPGDLPEKIAEPPITLSRQLRSKLMKQGAGILERLKRFSPSVGSCLDVNERDTDIAINNERNIHLLARYGFYSLRRLLTRPAKASITTEQTQRRPRDYQAITTIEDLQRVVTALGKSAYCALDTESSDKDPHTAELLGVSISVKTGEAFYIPTFANDLNGMDRNSVISSLRRLLEGPIKVTGHNLKFDYVLLRRNGIKIANVCFDTMLAAYDCFGDADVLNLQYLAKRLLGRTVKSHREIVFANQTLLDLPFRDVTDYACDHAEVTLQLGDVLQRELTLRGIDQQYSNETVPMVKTLGDWEVDGIRVDLAGLCCIQELLANQMLRAKVAAVDGVGCRFNPDSEKEVMAILKMNQTIAKILGFRKLSSGVLEELAIAHRAAQLLVRYNRCQKRLRYIDAVIQSVQNGRMHPVFSQTRTDYSRLSSVKPTLFDVDDTQALGSCMPRVLCPYCPDASRSLGILADAAGDNVLQADVLLAKESGLLPNASPLIEGDHFQLLLSVVVGVSDRRICKTFLLDGDAIAAIRHSFRVRYASSFTWLEQFLRETATKGFASFRGRRRYLDGLRSSNLGKRDKAMHSAIRWVIGW